MDVIVHYWAGLVKIRKFKTSEIKIFIYTCMYYKIVVIYASINWHN